MTKMTDLKWIMLCQQLGHWRQILEKSYVLSSGHSFEPICMIFYQNVWHHKMLDKIETGSSLVKM